MLLKRFTQKKVKLRTDGSAAVPRRRLNSVEVDTAARGMNDNDLTQSEFTSSRRQHFARNQTLTGSTSQMVSSAAEMSGTIQSPRAATHHLRRKQRSLGKRIVGLLVLGGMTLLFLFEFIAGTTISYYGQVTTGADTEDVAVYQQLVNEYLSGRPLERLRPFLNEERLVAYMNDTEASEVRQITAVASAGLGRVQLVIKMREPVVAWTIDGQRRYVDSDGYIFTINHYEEPSVTVVDESGISNNSDIKTVASGRFLQFIGRGVGFARTEGISIDQVIIPVDTTRQVQFAVTNNERTRIKLSVDRPVGEQVEDAARAHQFLKERGVKARYIDVRVSGRAYYIEA